MSFSPPGHPSKYWLSSMLLDVHDQKEDPTSTPPTYDHGLGAKKFKRWRSFSEVIAISSRSWKKWSRSWSPINDRRSLIACKLIAKCLCWKYQKFTLWFSHQKRQSFMRFPSMKTFSMQLFVRLLIRFWRCSFQNILSKEFLVASNQLYWMNVTFSDSQIFN